jgi:hypothetical protein
MRFNCVGDCDSKYHEDENIKMNVLVEIHYKTKVGGRSLQHGSFSLKGRRSDMVALHWWKEIKKLCHFTLN